jgi:hypothetical protein
MPVELITTDRKFFTQYKNGDTFASSTTDFTTNLACEVGEKIKLVTQLQVSWYFQCSTANQVDWEDMGSNLYRFRKQNLQSWTVDGFSEGDTVELVATSTVTATLATLTPEWMYLQFASPISADSSGTYTTPRFNGQTSLTALIYKFGLVDNNDNYNSTSFVTGNTQSYYASGLVVSTPQNMTSQGQYKDWVTGSMTCEKLVSADANVQKFEVSHILKVPYYQDGELSNLEDNVIPDWLTGLASLKYTCEYELMTALSNPNTSKKAIDQNNLGSLGWFNENFNGFENDYAIDSITYEDTAANSASGLIVDSETVVKITVSKISGAFVATDKIGLMVSYLPDVNEYQNTTTSFDDNFMYENAYRLANGISTSGTIINSIKADLVSGDILITANIEHTAAQKITLSGKASPSFLLGVNVGDITKTNANSDRVMLIAGVGEYDKSADIPGLITLNDFRFFSEDEEIGVDAGSTDYVGWNEDGIACTFDFDLDLNKSALINTLDIKLLAYNTVTGAYFELDNYSYDINSTVISSGVQQLNLTDTRGYTLASGSQFNDVSISVGSQAAGIQNYTGTFSQKISWQDWINNLNADTVFYDSAKPNNNLNYKASNYSMLNDYEIKIGLYANVFGENTTLNTTGNTDYLMLTPNIDIYDWDLDWNVSPEWTATIETFDESETNNLGGEILTDGNNTLVKTTFVNNLSPITSIYDFWSMHRVQEQNGLYNNAELSSINLPPSGQLPIPVPPATLLDMSIVGADVVTKSLIDGSTLDPNKTYRLSSRIQTPNATAVRKTWWYWTESITPDTLIFTITNAGAAVDWNWADTPTIELADNSVTHTYSVTGFKFAGFRYDNYTDITGVDFSGNDIWTGATLADGVIIDLSMFPDLDSINLSNNTIINTVVFPTSSTVINYVLAHSCDLTGNIDISGFSGFAGGLAVYNNPNLTSVTNPTSSGIITGYNVDSCNITGTLDVSGLSGLGGAFDAGGNVNLTKINNPTSTQTFSAYRAASCDLGYFSLLTLTNLTESNNVDINLSNNSMTVIEVNHYLEDFDTLSTGAFTGRTINIAGTNAAPDGSSGGFDGLTAKANLIAKGFTVTTN